MCIAANYKSKEDVLSPMNYKKKFRLATWLLRHNNGESIEFFY